MPGSICLLNVHVYTHGLVPLSVMIRKASLSSGWWLWIRTSTGQSMVSKTHAQHWKDIYITLCGKENSQIIQSREWWRVLQDVFLQIRHVTRVMSTQLLSRYTHKVRHKCKRGTFWDNWEGSGGRGRRQGGSGVTMIIVHYIHMRNSQGELSKAGSRDGFTVPRICWTYSWWTL